MNSSISFSLEAPTFVPKSFPLLNKRIVGTPLTECFVKDYGGGLARVVVAKRVS